MSLIPAEERIASGSYRLCELSMTVVLELEASDTHREGQRSNAPEWRVVLKSHHQLDRSGTGNQSVGARAGRCHWLRAPANVRRAKRSVDDALPCTFLVLAGGLPRGGRRFTPDGATTPSA
jgi:hypothetical protein